MQSPIYLDYNASTPVDPRVLLAMSPYFSETFGNPSSVDHQHGARAAEGVENARHCVAEGISARPEEIIFTSGATESDNLALIGVMEANEDRGDHLITCRTEHPAVLETAAYLTKRGKHVTLLDVDRSGRVNPEAVRSAVTSRTVLISVMAVNNEIGTLAPIAEIGRIAHERGVYFHTDAAQAVGRMEIDVQKLGIDLMSFSSHKLYGPKGIGALYVRRRQPHVRLSPLIHGGGHERGLRSGTMNASGIVGFGKAMQIWMQECRSEQHRLAQLGTSLLQTLLTKIPGAELNGHPSDRLSHCINLFIPGVENRALIVALKDEVSFSAGSACTTSKVEPSHVLLSLGYPEDRSHKSIRLSIGRFTTEEDIARTIEVLVTAVNSLRTSFSRT